MIQTTKMKKSKKGSAHGSYAITQGSEKIKRAGAILLVYFYFFFGPCWVHRVPSIETKQKPSLLGSFWADTFLGADTKK